MRKRRKGMPQQVYFGNRKPFVSVYASEHPSFGQFLFGWNRDQRASKEYGVAKHMGLKPAYRVNLRFK